MELKRKVLEFTLEGKVYKVRKPTMLELENLSKQGEELSDVDKISNLIDACGFPKDVFLSLDPELAEIVIEEVVTKKKK